MSTQLNTNTIQTLQSALLLTISALHCAEHPLEIAIALESVAQTIRIAAANQATNDAAKNEIC